MCSTGSMAVAVQGTAVLVLLVLIAVPAGAGGRARSPPVTGADCQAAETRAIAAETKALVAETALVKASEEKRERLETQLAELEDKVNRLTKMVHSAANWSIPGIGEVSKTLCVLLASGVAVAWIGWSMDHPVN